MPALHKPMSTAASSSIERLHLTRRHPNMGTGRLFAEIVAKTVIEIGATGVREPSEISKIAVKRLVQLGRPRLEAPTGQEIFADF